MAVVISEYDFDIYFDDHAPKETRIWTRIKIGHRYSWTVWLPQIWCFSWLVGIAGFRVKFLPFSERYGSQEWDPILGVGIPPPTKLIAEKRPILLVL
jgi:hypothetical protein